MFSFILNGAPLCQRIEVYGGAHTDSGHSRAPSASSPLHPPTTDIRCNSRHVCFVCQELTIDGSDRRPSPSQVLPFIGLFFGGAAAVIAFFRTLLSFAAAFAKPASIVSAPPAAPGAVLAIVLDPYTFHYIIVGGPGADRRIWLHVAVKRRRRHAGVIAGAQHDLRLVTDPRLAEQVIRGSWHMAVGASAGADALVPRGGARRRVNCL